MNTILEYPNINTETFAYRICNRDGILNNPVYNWLIHGKLPENIVRIPLYRRQTVESDAKNRYLNSVTILPIKSPEITIALAVDATATFNFIGAESTTSSNPAIATATISNEIVTVTGVAEGTTQVTIKDRFDDIITIVTVTVA